MTTYRFERDHNDDEYHYWYMAQNAPHEYRDSIGRRVEHGTTSWVKLTCNNIGCPGSVWVNIHAILENNVPLHAQTKEKRVA